MQGASTCGGFAFALDVLYATENACMHVAMAEIGLIGCDIGASYFLPRSVDTSNTAEMLAMSPIELRMSKEGLNWHRVPVVLTR